MALSVCGPTDRISSELGLVVEQASTLPCCQFTNLPETGRAHNSSRLLKVYMWGLRAWGRHEKEAAVTKNPLTSRSAGHLPRATYHMCTTAREDVRLWCF